MLNVYFLKQLIFNFSKFKNISDIMIVYLFGVHEALKFIKKFWKIV